MPAESAFVPSLFLIEVLIDDSNCYTHCHGIDGIYLDRARMNEELATNDTTLLHGD